MSGKIISSSQLKQTVPVHALVADLIQKESAFDRGAAQYAF